MAEENKEQQQQQAQQEQAKAEAAEAAASQAGDKQADSGPDPFELAKTEIGDLRNKVVRWQAEFQNLQRRSAREVLEARQRAEADFAKGLIDVLDQFDLAISHSDKADAQTLANGIKMTYDVFKKVLAGKGIESYDPTGQPFDPHQHEAIMQDASGNAAPNTVTQTFQVGWRSGDIILRPAKVKVSK